MLQRILPVDCKEADVVLLQKNNKHEDVEIFQLGDAMKNENLADVSLCRLDPNQHQVFAAAYEEENMEDILLNIPTTKTAILSNYLQYITYILSHLNRILAFNNFSTAESRFHLYQGVQRDRQEMANVLIN
ncbi:uncharacterized protein BX663DRAFT_509388, partial [Cokeromyces recurvatus]|uniref:uncharacterized protein n=1 Tax=Cokeromyces recurvatus TaxID=90255 RepID=UPI002220CFE5